MDAEWIWDRLEPIEQLIADLLLLGKSNKEITAEAGLSRARTQEYIKRIVIKAGAASTREALVLLTQERETSSLLQILDEATDAVVILQDGLCRFANSALVKMLGYAAQEMVDMPFTGFVAPGARDEQSKRYEERLKGEPFPGRYATRALCKTGEPKQVEVTSGGVVRYKGRPAMMAIVVEKRRVGPQ
jgi:PAS domain S-box-containing protein